MGVLVPAAWLAMEAIVTGLRDSRRATFVCRLRPMTRLVLGFDTSAGSASLALCRAAGERAMLIAGPDEAGRSSRDVLPWAQSALHLAGGRRADLAAVGVTRGPGSFTGLRIGLGVGVGIAIGSGVPIYGISTLEAMIEAALELTGDPGKRWPVALLPAGKDHLYVGFRERTGVLSERVVARPDLLETLPRRGRLLLIGEGARQNRARLGLRGSAILESAGPLASAVARMAAAALGRGEAGDPSTLRAVYLRSSGALTPAERERRKAP